MDKHWDHYCTMSIVHFMAFPETIRGDGPIVETVTKIAEDPFFGAIEIGWIKDPAVRAKVRKVVETAHIQVGHGAGSALLLSKVNLNSLDEPERMKAVQQLCRNVDEAAEVGAQRVVFLSGADPGDADRPRALEALATSVKQVAAYARDKGIALTMETFDRTVDKKCLIGPSPLAANFCKAIREDFPDFGLLYDLSHMPLLYETPDAAFNELKDCLVHIHVGNSVLGRETPGYGDQHPRFGWPGGVNDTPQVTEFIRSLFKAGYLKEHSAARPWIGFEVKPQSKEESSALVIAGAKRVWQEAWSRA
ncbi:MAG: TIM barrel protein [Bryobacteraceae bacterium]|jgi:sugar phosphate isomerase/epimerase